MLEESHLNIQTSIIANQLYFAQITSNDLRNREPGWLKYDLALRKSNRSGKAMYTEPKYITSFLDKFYVQWASFRTYFTLFLKSIQKKCLMLFLTPIARWQD